MTETPTEAPGPSGSGASVMCSKCGANERASKGSWCRQCRRDYQANYNRTHRVGPQEYRHPCERWGCSAEVIGISGRGPKQRYCSRGCNDLAQQQKLANKRRAVAANRQVRIDMHARGERRCSSCKQVKRLTEDFHKNNDPRHLGYQQRCKECTRLWQLDNPEAVRRASWSSHLRRRFKLTLETWDTMLVAQQGRCAICLDPMTEPHVDHDHACCDTYETCGRCIRGLLCESCNYGLGKFQDSILRLEAAVRYLGSNGQGR